MLTGAPLATTRPPSLTRATRFAFLTLPNYSMIALANALEACRMANYVAGTAVYHWQVATLDGAKAVASNGLSLDPTIALDEADFHDILFVCGGIDVRQATDTRLRDRLRRIARRGAALGALCTGTFALAEAGLLDGYRCAIHWENLSAIREEFPGLDFADDLFVIDRDRITCTGGIAPLDMMLSFIDARLGGPVAAKVGAQFMVERPRPPTDRQTAPSAPHKRLHAAVRDAVRVMADTIEAPMPLTLIASRIGLSTRQLERQFRHDLDCGPAQYYAMIRLDRARELLRLTELSVTEIGVACGFQSASHFSTRYARRFGYSPMAERRA